MSRIGLASHDGKTTSPPRPGPSTINTRFGRPPRVVVVEDEAIIAMQIEMLLEDLGTEVVGTATTAEEAVTLAHVHRPDLMTMDIHIRDAGDGVSAAIEIYESVGIRSILVSAYVDGETETRAERANPLGWVKKPFTGEDLISAFTCALDDV